MSPAALHTTTTRGSVDSQTRERSVLDQLAPGRLARRRNWPRVGAALSLAIVSGALFVLLYVSAGSRQPFLAVARAVPAGGMVRAGDLATARVAPDRALRLVPVQAASSVIGRRAAVALVPGTLLTAGDLAAGPVVGDSGASVGLDLKPGEVPAGLSPGDAVLVVETNNGSGGPSQVATGGTGQQAGLPTVLVERARVLAVAAPSAATGSSSTDVTIEVPAPLAAVVATAASAGDVALAGLGPGGGP